MLEVRRTEPGTRKGAGPAEDRGGDVEVLIRGIVNPGRHFLCVAGHIV
jgi:hypothetical protein